MDRVKHRLLSLALFLLCGSLSAWAAALGTSPRSAIPADVQQIIVVDYRAFNDSASARSLKERLTTPRLREFEAALRKVGIVPGKEVEQLAFASFRSKGMGLQMVGIAEGSFTREKVVHGLRMKGVRPQKDRLAVLYPMDGGMAMTFLEDSALLFGEPAAVKLALEARQGEIPSVNSNAQITDLMNGMDAGAVWSVLDAEGTRNMVRSALGQSSQLADSESLMKRLRGTRYTADFSRGCEFNMDISTADSFTAATLSSLFKVAMSVRKLSAKGGEKIALEGLSVDSDGNQFKARFESDEERFQALLKSDLFASISK